MKRMAALVVITGVALVGAVPTASPAAAVDGHVQAENAILYEGCSSWDIDYSVSLPGASRWSIDFDVVGRDGLSTGSAYAYGDGPYASGTEDHQICSFEDAGQWTVESNGEWCDADYNCYPFTLPTSSFKVKRAQTRTSLSASPKNPAFNHVVTFTVHVKDQRPRGYFPSDGVDVVLQIFRNGSWVKAREGDMWVYDGKDSQSYRWDVRGLVKVRAVTKRQDNLEESKSNVLKIR